MAVLTAPQTERYSRQILLKGVGGRGQERLLNGRVLIVGAGGLGAPIALFLAAAGIGTIGIADADVVDISNLHRQVIHSHHARETVGGGSQACLNTSHFLRYRLLGGVAHAVCPILQDPRRADCL